MSVATRTLGNVIKKYRKLNGYSTQAFSEKFNISCGLINNIEHDRSDFFKIDLLMSIIKELHIPINEVLPIDDVQANDKVSISNQLEIKSDKSYYLYKNLDAITQLYLNVVHQYEDNENAATIICNVIINNLMSLQDLKLLK